jgi:hypothetical protein
MMEWIGMVGLGNAAIITRYKLLRVGAMWLRAYELMRRAALGHCDDVRWAL